MPVAAPRDRRRKRVSAVDVDARDVTRTNDIKYGLCHGGRSPGLAPAGGFFPRPVRLVKQGLPVLRGQAGLRASSSGKWLIAYIYQPLPTLCHPYACTQIVSLTGYLRVRYIYIFLLLFCYHRKFRFSLENARRIYNRLTVYCKVFMDFKKFF